MKQKSLKDDSDENIQVPPAVVVCSCGRAIKNKLADMNDGKIHLCNECVERLLLKGR